MSKKIQYFKTKLNDIQSEMSDLLVEIVGCKLSSRLEFKTWYVQNIEVRDANIKIVSTDTHVAFVNTMALMSLANIVSRTMLDKVKIDGDSKRAGHVSVDSVIYNMSFQQILPSQFGAPKT